MTAQTKKIKKKKPASLINLRYSTFPPFDRLVSQTLAGHHAPKRLKAALEYVLTLPSKRIRPLLAFGAAATATEQIRQAVPAAVAVELVHSYSLVHDDLPAMDNDDLRRGKPSCHIAFEEATAILVGDALQALAFEVIATHYATHPNLAPMLQTLAKACGPSGIVGGQMLDMQLTASHATDFGELTKTHRLKTGALIKAAVKLGALAAGAAYDTLPALNNYAEHIGMAFQIKDDILEIESTTAALGKNANSDALNEKFTYPKCLGIDGAKMHLNSHYHSAKLALEPFKEKAGYLLELAKFIIEREL